MKHLLKVLCLLFASCFIFAGFTANAAAAEAGTATMRVDVRIDQPTVFWNYTFLTKDADFGKPAAVKLKWGIGDTKRQETTQTIVNPGDKKGRLEITTEKGALVNFQVAVVDADNAIHGTLGFQVRNNGQTELVTIAPPDFSEPQITFGAPNSDQQFQ